MLSLTALLNIAYIAAMFSIGLSKTEFPNAVSVALWRRYFALPLGLINREFFSIVSSLNAHLRRTCSFLCMVLYQFCIGFLGMTPLPLRLLKFRPFGGQVAISLHLVGLRTFYFPALYPCIEREKELVITMLTSNIFPSWRLLWMLSSRSLQISASASAMD